MADRRSAPRPKKAAPSIFTPNLATCRGIRKSTFRHYDISHSFFLRITEGCPELEHELE